MFLVHRFHCARLPGFLLDRSTWHARDPARRAAAYTGYKIAFFSMLELSLCRGCNAGISTGKPQQYQKRLVCLVQLYGVKKTGLKRETWTLVFCPAAVTSARVLLISGIQVVPCLDIPRPPFPDQPLRMHVKPCEGMVRERKKRIKEKKSEAAWCIITHHFEETSPWTVNLVNVHSITRVK